MDTYTKVVLTITAAALVVLAGRGLAPQTAEAGIFQGGPTFGDFRRLGEIKDKSQRDEALRDLIYRLPMVRIHGSVNVN
ncbi:MAG: hypothetical protein COW30_03925 [Rhodospirillales bacterium CG15_BIG_FIL_POST_REV_8_21_14_020_66_15]|nr:MAG: hypothetical protein COW30_03925 [Rhodospirillales bacterium CG15_BIG_FIL_POST_REV_8_21_14_020_66_15]